MNAPMHVDDEKIADNSTLQVMARLSMLFTPILITLVSFFAWQWFDGQAKATVQLRTDFNELSAEIPKVKERVSVMETNQQRGRADREDFQERSLRQQEQMLQMLRTQGEAIAALTSTVTAQQGQINQILNYDRRR